MKTEPKIAAAANRTRTTPPVAPVGKMFTELVNNFSKKSVASGQGRVTLAKKD
jgi:hypothetical protein